MELEDVLCKQQTDNQRQGSGYGTYNEQTESDIPEALYETRSGGYSHYSDEHIQPYIIQYPQGSFGDTSERRMLAA